MSVETILVAVGPQDREHVERLAEKTVDIAGPTGARVVLAQAFTDDQYHDSLSRLNLGDGEVTPDTVAERNATIRDLRDLLRDADIDFDIRGRVGDPGDTMVDLAEDCDADILVVGGRRRSPAGKAVFGSDAQSILLSSPCPVLYVGTGTD